jgi:protein-L-isoaspartate(D-aspartate) O-methyltransferase
MLSTSERVAVGHYSHANRPRRISGRAQETDRGGSWDRVLQRTVGNLTCLWQITRYNCICLTEPGHAGMKGFMNDEPKKFARWRKDMVDRQIIARGVTDPLVIRAMTEVPRHLFVSEALVDSAYGDFPLPIGEGQTISQPYIIAEMTQSLELKGSERVLEIGTGSGYQAAILAHMVYRVYTIERNHPLFLQTRQLFDRLRIHNVVTRYSDGTQGWKEESPFDAIIVTAGGNKIPSPLVDQLAPGGRLVLPVGGHFSQELIKLTRTDTGIKQENLGGCRFVKLIGQHGWNE